MLRWRIALGAALIALLVGLFWLDSRAATPGIWLMPLVLAITVLASDEVVRLLSTDSLAGRAWLVHVANVGIVLANWAGIFETPLNLQGWAGPAAALGVATVIIAASEIQRYERQGGAVSRLTQSVFALVYVGVLLSFVVQLRYLGPDGGWGLAAVASLVLVVKCNDTAAYTVGRLIGRTKMAPTLSPGKTIEGGVGGLAGGIFGAWLGLAVLAPRIAGESVPTVTWSQWLIFGVLVGVAGMLGDLIESLLKREAGQKDSSHWMPGFGGVLDLLDSVLLAAPVAYVCSVWMGWN